MRGLVACGALLFAGCGAANPTADAGCIHEGYEVGDRFPDFTYPDCAENSVTMQDSAGDALLFNLSTGWCQPCRIETPRFQDFFEGHETEGLSIVQVLAEDDDVTPAAPEFCGQWKAEFGLTYSVVFTPGTATLASYYEGAPLFPLNIVVDRNGCVTYRAVGESGFDSISAALLDALE